MFVLCPKLYKLLDSIQARILNGYLQLLRSYHYYHMIIDSRRHYHYQINHDCPTPVFLCSGLNYKIYKVKAL